MPGLKYIIELGAELAPSATAAFGGITAEIDQTKGEIKELNAEQRELTRRMRGVDEGTDEYRELERSLTAVNRRSEALNATLVRQERRLRTVNRVSRASGRIFAANTAALGAFSAAMVLTTNHVGQYSQELLTANRATGLSVEYLQLLQRQAKATGRDLDFQGLGEVAIRFGEAVAEGTGPAAEALERLGFDARTVAISDIPAVIGAINQLETDAARRFEFDEIFAGSEGETLADIANLPPETLNRIERLNTLSAESAQRFADQKDRLDALNISFGHTSANVAGAFLPVMEDVSDNLLPIVEGFGDWAENNEDVVRGLLATVAASTAVAGAIVLITKKTAILNGALAVRAALSGPAGWAALIAAAGVGVGAYAISGGFGNKADEAEADTSRLVDAQQETTDLLRTSTGPGAAPQPVRDRDLIRQYGGDRKTLQNILSTMQCQIDNFGREDELTPASPSLNMDEDSPEFAFLAPNAGVTQGQVDRAIRQYDQERARVGLADAADRRVRSDVAEFRALAEATGVTSGQYFSARQLIDPSTGLGDIGRIPERELERAIDDIRAAFPDEARDVPKPVGRYATGLNNLARHEPLDQHALPPYLRNATFATDERGEVLGMQPASRFSYGDGAAPSVQAGAYGPHLVAGIPPRVEQAGAQYSRGDTHNTFYIEAAVDPEMDAVAIRRQLDRQADEAYW